MTYAIGTTLFVVWCVGYFAAWIAMTLALSGRRQWPPVAAFVFAWIAAAFWPLIGVAVLVRRRQAAPA